MTELVIATWNYGKLQEFKELLGGLPLKLRSLNESPGALAPHEEATTFHGNALLKAQASVRTTGYWSLGDDSGLCVDALGGAPGLYSARYAPGTDTDRWKYLLESMKDIREGNRQAAFVCVVALCGPNGEQFFGEGRCEGRIGFEARGPHGFGYDPVFIVAEDASGRTMAELSSDEKHAVSHRGRAVAALWPKLDELARTGKVEVVRR